MEKIIEKVKEYKIVVLTCLVMLLGVMYLNVNGNKKSQVTETKPMTEVVQKKDPMKSKENEPKNMMVDVQGEVKHPGVFKMNKGSIVLDAVKMAGGITESGDIRQVNQAQRVTDAMQIYIPHIGEKSAVASGNTNSGSQSSDKSKTQVNINTAAVEDFQSVSGIGPKKAEKIIEFREKNGNFAQLEDLTKVSGIGDKTLETLRDSLTV
ncbi:helix-hairpin-helix domain-containing protein [Companilactobacillus mishanensis]|uniref:ComEA family DNA-binding protein n=1 Tax=Companilactobacillus mishanensis TaxID=2486008 RepID=A0A5P0ZGW2_9LACO|nr:helix-hairpin-helix domain-containing protein [Companilactobacillus mishanensis]MQS52296.1 ComEA family DNA-binding protein [Companilactobacillus mishanensis]